MAEDRVASCGIVFVLLAESLQGGEEWPLRAGYEDNWRLGVLAIDEGAHAQIIASLGSLQAEDAVSLFGTDSGTDDDLATAASTADSSAWHEYA